MTDAVSKYNVWVVNDNKQTMGHPLDWMSH